MKKNNIGHFETFWRGLFTQVFPDKENGGETSQERQPTIDEIWDWIGHPEVEDSV